jgi:hypothetical protein
MVADMNNKYKFYNFFDQIQDVNGKPTNVVKGFHKIFEIECDQPLRAYNSFRKENSQFDLMVENSESLILAGDNLKLYKVTFDTLVKHYTQRNPNVVFLMSEDIFLKAIQND